MRHQHFALALSLSLAPAVLLATSYAQAAPLEFPKALEWSDVTTYGAVAGANVDAAQASKNTAAILKAMHEGRDASANPNACFGTPRTVFFPPGVFVVDDTLQYVGCCLTLQGSGVGETVLRLRTSASGFADPSKPKALLRTSTGNFSHADNVFDLTLDTGSGNPGAAGAAFYANNTGAMSRIDIVSGDGAGVAGLYLREYAVGPCLFNHIGIRGFDVGIDVGNAEYGPAFEHLVLEDQKVAAIQNDGNTLAFRKLRTRGKAPAYRSTAEHSAVIFIDSSFEGGASDASALADPKGSVLLRNVLVDGYAGIRPGSTDKAIVEWTSAPVRTLFDSTKSTLGLPVLDVPEPPLPAPSSWVTPYRNPNRGDGGYGDTAGYQAAFDAGKPVVYFDGGGYLQGGGLRINVPAGVERVTGLGSNINTWDDQPLTLVVKEPSDKPLIIERFHYGVTVEHSSPRTVVVRHGNIAYQDLDGAGDTFLSDLVGEFHFKAKHRIWTRQFNIEHKGLHASNHGAQLWVFGMKTEQPGTALETIGGATEVLGTLLYPLDNSADAAFVSQDAAVSYSIAISAYSGNYENLVQETRGTDTRKLATADVGRALTLFAGHQGTPSTGGSGAGGAGSGGVGVGGTPVVTGADGGSSSGGLPPLGNAGKGSGATTGNGATSGSGAASGSGANGGDGAGDAGNNDSGCGCRTAPSSGSPLALVSGLLAWLLTRRRRAA